MREICTSGSVRGGDGDIPTYSAFDRAQGIETFGEGVGLRPGPRVCRRNAARRPRTPPAIVRGTMFGTVGRGRAPAERTPACTPPIEFDPAKGHRLGQCSADAGGDTHAHNTLSPNDTGVQVFYPFHPLHGATMQILRRPKRGDGAVCVMDPSGRRLKIPVWMLSQECADIMICERPHLGKEALLSLASLIASQPDSRGNVHDDLLQTPVGECEGGYRGATSTSGPDDSKGMRCGVNGRSDTRASHRSHGPRCSGGVSRGAEKQ